jgi:hypothetical protein
MGNASGRVHSSTAGLRGRNGFSPDSDGHVSSRWQYSRGIGPSPVENHARACVEPLKVNRTQATPNTWDGRRDFASTRYRAAPAPIRSGSDSETPHRAVADDSRPCGTAGPFMSGKFVANDMPCTIGRAGNLPSGWPDARGFLPPAPSPVRPPCIKNRGPVLTLAPIFRSDNPSFTESMAEYTRYRDDDRFGRWQTYFATERRFHSLLLSFARCRNAFDS